MDEKQRCLLVFLLFVFLKLTTAQEDEQVMGDYEPQMQGDYNRPPFEDQQVNDGFGSYMPKFLQAKFGKSLAKPPSYPDSAESGEPELKSRMFSGDTDPSFRKSSYTKTSGGGRGKYGSGESQEAGGYSGGCRSRPSTPMNSALRCSSYSGCRASCLPGYNFPNAESQLYITCQDGEWRVEGVDDPTIPHCEPMCLPACQHNGICVGPNQCNCAENFSGPQCQFEKRPCLNPAPLPANSRRSCSSKACTISCAQGFQFPGGSSIANMMCKDGTWVPSRPDWVTVPDCEAICEPGCQNGGNCLAFNVCQCPQEFTGPQCQYRMDACSSEKLKSLFKGGFSCSGDAESFACTLSCPPGIPFKQPPAAKYICRYATGRFEPQPIPECNYPSNVQVMPGHSVVSSSMGSGFDSIFLGADREFTDERHGYNTTRGKGSYGGHSQLRPVYLEPLQTVVSKRPTPGVCYTWGGGHYKTFDGKLISFDSDCSYTLVRDSVDNTFSVNLIHKDGHKAIKIFAQNKEYLLTLSSVGIPILEVGKREHAIPSQLSGLTTEYIAHFVVATLTGIGVSVKWDAKNFVSVSVNENLWNRTAGLCGRIDGHKSNDLETKTGQIVKTVPTFINSWQVQELGESCNTTPLDESSCDPTSPLSTAASTFCSQLLTASRFSPCHSLVDAREYHAVCTWDYCACRQADRRRCACDSMAVYARECRAKGKHLAWRDKETCPVECTGGRVFSPCGPATQPTCGAATESPTSHGCEEGCYCPEGLVLHEGNCVKQADCPCQLRGKQFEAGAKIPKDCNTCTCSAGQWVCTQVLCGSRCGSIGDPHYVTFDGKRYDFMGTCSYHLMKGDDYSVEAENVACAGTISQTLGFSLSSHEMPSCTKTVTVRVGDRTIKLKQHNEVLVDGLEVTDLPKEVDGAYIHVVSSIFIKVELPNGLSIWWDGVTRVYVDAPASFQGNTKGLCGTFNQNQKDDFLTPEGDVEQSVPAFANKWKTSDKCEDIVDKPASHPCEMNPHNKEAAEKHCAKLKSNMFKDCHWLVDYEPYYADCMYDMCSCQGDKPGDCMCPIIAAYAEECARFDYAIDWRNEIRECGVHCPGGQTYQVCGNSCTRTCHDQSRLAVCQKECVEGCNCPEGQTLGATGECVPVAECKCTHNELDFEPGYREVRRASKGPELCTCQDGAWDCRPATAEEQIEYPDSKDLASTCRHSEHMVYTQCEPPEPVTCHNMHHLNKASSAVCRGGCVCQKGYVLDSYAGKCIEAGECPCHHGGRSFADGETMQEDCNTCTCSSGKWSCTDRICSGMCSAWGDAHFTTFDGRSYDFRGTCDYVLVKGALSGGKVGDNFDVTVQNVPCSSSGVSCSKSVTLNVAGESVTFARGKPVPAVVGERIAVREAGLFVYAEVFDLGIVLQWDRGTRVYVKADPRWKGKMKGLCGNYNNNEMDDFETPSGGVSEVSAALFGDSWRLQSYCPETSGVIDTCELHPHRKTWASQKCGLLKSDLFRACHTEVPVDEYHDRCVSDACGCDLGGDCECLCTALAAYAQQCNVRGVPVKWRSQELCPIQCDAKCSRYSPCIETCPQKTCDNQFVHKAITQLCAEDACVEGCALDPCPAGQLYNNLTSLECVPESSCNTVCMQVGDVVYYEGDKMAGDDCHTCFCSRHKESCIGTPCADETTESTASTTVAPPIEDKPVSGCVDGWSEWVNSHRGKGYGDSEPVPTWLQLQSNAPESGRCEADHMTGIRCRTADTHQSATDVGQDVKCSLDGGLTCKGKCYDFEISVLCQCTAASPPLPRARTHAPSHCPTENTPHETDCHLFYHCMDTPQGAHLVEKTCGRDMMYNPETMTCDWPATVAAIRPFCGEIPSTSTTTTKYTRPKTTDKFERPTTTQLQTTRTTVGKYVQPTTGTTTTTAKYVQPTASTTTTTAKYVQRTTTARPVRLRGCVDGWTDWYNSTATPDGDFELLDGFEAADAIPCERGQIKDIQCKFYKSVNIGKAAKGRARYKTMMVDYTESGNEVSCTTDVGLKCDSRRQMYGNCEDYAVKLFCDCRVTEVASTEVPQPITEIPLEAERPVSPCPPGFEWSDCAIPCAQVCHFFGFTLRRDGACAAGQVCMPGCVDLSIARCPPGSRWRDKRTCVADTDCTCQDNSGNVVKPGSVVWESDCKVCQCVRNQYTCDASSCKPTPSTAATPEVVEEVTVTPTQPPWIIPSSATPPQDCLHDMFNYLVETLDPTAFSASSSLGPQYQPDSAKLNARVTPSSGGSWVPQYSTPDQYLQVDLGRVEPVYGVVTQGSPLADDYVTSYSVLVSTDGDSFSYVVDAAGRPAVFRGPYDGRTPAKQVFAVPVEARYVRFSPRTYEGAMAMRVEVIGCGEGGTTVTPTLPPVVEETECLDDMGLENGMLSDQQVTVSSVLDDAPELYGRAQLRPDGKGWLPKAADTHPWVMFDFLEPRNVTGLVSKGQPEGDRWVEAFKVKYSHDGQAWNPIIDTDFEEMVFPANYDSDSPVENKLPLMIQAQYFKVVPVKWHEGVALRLEIHGCYLPYPTLPPTPPPVLTSPSPCQMCAGVSKDIDQLFSDQPCPCSHQPDRLWDGENCVPSSECPCFIGHMSYAVGTVFDSEECEQCTCSLGGFANCQEKTCPKCPRGLQSVKTPSCGCVCKHCPIGSVLCPTSNICIDEGFWCDGVQHCPDDELDCPTRPPPPTTETATTTTTTEAPTTASQPRTRAPCKEVICPPGYVQVIKTFASTLELVDEPAAYNKKPAKGTKGGRQGGKKTATRAKPVKMIDMSGGEDCPPVECVFHTTNKTNKADHNVSVVTPPPCPTPQCPDTYTLKYIASKGINKDCPSFECVPPEIPPASCHVTERSFNTFDNTEYKYDICNHVMARDADSKHDWQISLSKNCSALFDCQKHVTVRQDDQTVTLDLDVKYSGNVYSAYQANKIAALTRGMEISLVGDLFYLKSKIYDFWLTWDKQANLKIWVNGKLSGHVDGLCGFFNGVAGDDKQKPDGRAARTGVEFGDSWALKDVPEHCAPLRCPLHVQDQALAICRQVREKPFTRCADHVREDHFVSRCVESTCSCLDAANSSADACQCQALLSYVTECQASNPGVDLSSWRVEHNCKPDCPHQSHDCYRRSCELSCENLMVEDACPILSDVCFPGCYCPEGTVRKGDACVEPAQCRDCACDGFGDPTYINFDRANFTFNGNCTYVASRDVSKTGRHDFQVLVTNGPCLDKPGLTCTDAITVLREGHKVQVQRAHEDKELVTRVNDVVITAFPHRGGWVQVETIPGNQVTVLVPAIQLEVTLFYHNHAFIIRLPSQLYKNKTEGLCGNCNCDLSDDLKTSDDVLTDDVDAFGLSWLQPADGENQEDCKTNQPIVACLPLPPDQDPCYKLKDEDTFGKCHAVVDPAPYLSACQAASCRGEDVAVTVCRDLEAYARECLRQGICVDWRTQDVCPHNCDEGTEYAACGSGCQKTCDNYKLEDGDDSCQLSSVIDTCVCPEGKVFRGGECVASNRCSPCDEEGHYDGDVWQVDKCTACKCDEGTRMCSKTECATLVCQQGEDEVVVKGSEDECCPKYLCVETPRTGPTCPSPQQPLCSGDQVLKLDTLPNGCQQFICQCKALEECDNLVELESDGRSAAQSEELPAGMVRKLNTSGCCPKFELECDLSLCHKPGPCEQHYIQAELQPVQGACCPTYACEPPKDACIYEFQYEADVLLGGERPRKQSKKYTDVKPAGTSWHDGPCRSCACSGSPVRGYQASCAVEACPDLADHEEASEYQLIAEPVQDKCCPAVKRTACKVQGLMVEVGNEVVGDKCETLACVESKDGVRLQKTVEKCNTHCQQGEEYEEPEGDKCCGQCRQVACVVDGKLHRVDEKWQSEDHCDSFRCVRQDHDSVGVTSVRTECPDLPETELDEYVVEARPVRGECCKTHERVACLVDGVKHVVGDTWPDPRGDRCKVVTCARRGGHVVKVEEVHKCDEHCDKGWQYEPSPSDSPLCCGKCVQSACLVDGDIRQAGASWTAPGDNCTSFSCSQFNQQFQVTMHRDSCPNVDECPPQLRYKEGCCTFCNTTTASSLACTAEEVNILKTVDLIQEVVPRHGRCANLRPIRGFKECRGSCDSHSFYNASSAHLETDCKCCQPSSVDHVQVEMTCDDGYRYEKRVPMAADCLCLDGCGPDKSNIMKIPPAGVKTSGVKTAGGRRGY